MKTICILLIIILILYLYSIKPRLFHRPDYSILKGYYYAHRGLHNMNPARPEQTKGNIPENSYTAIQKAVEQGYGVEFDVHLTKDSIPVVFHDDSLERVCGVAGNLRDYTYEELQQFSLLGTNEKIPAFTDILNMVNGRVPLIIEYKVENSNANQLCSICNAILADYNGPYCIESFHPLAVHWYRTHRPDIIRGQLSEDFTHEKLTLPRFLFSHLIGNFYGAPDFVAYNCMHYNEISRRLCGSLYHCLKVAWTVRSKEQMSKVSPYYDLYIFEDFLPLN